MKANFAEYPRALKEGEPFEIADWNINHVIGAGGMGVVFFGNLIDDTKAAIKIINPDILSEELLKRFEREISAHKLINSPFVAKLLDSSIENDPPFMAIEFIHGKTLSKIIENKVKIEKSTWWLYARQIFSGLEQIHARGLVHRDIKPANIMKLEDKNMIKIIDLGIVKNEERRSSNNTQLIGTIPYMSPEQLLGKSATQKSDIFSAGITLVELITGTHPFIKNESNKSFDTQIVENEPDLKGLTADQRSFCEKLLKKNPTERITASDAIKICDDFILVAKVSWGPKPKKKIAPVKKNPIKKIESAKKIDPILVGVVDEFNPIIDSIIKNNSLIYQKNISSNENKSLNNSNEIQRNEISDNQVTLGKVIGTYLGNIGTKIFHINFYSIKFKSDVYYQGFVNARGNLLIEAMSDEFLPTKFSEEQKDKFLKLGWTSPKSTNPNFSTEFANNSVGRSQAAKLIAATSFNVYEINSKSELFLSPIDKHIISDIKNESNISVASDGSFTVEQKILENNKYEKWQLIGYMDKDYENDLVLKTLVARHIENNKVYRRQNKGWNFIGVIQNPVRNGIDKLNVQNGLLLNNKIINLFDSSESNSEYLTFEGVQKFLNYVPTLSAKYTDQEKAWPLTNEMIELETNADSEFDYFLSLFTLSTSNLNKNIVVGLFAKHPQTKNFYGRSDGKWKILFESPLTYGHEIFFVNKSFINFFDRRSKMLDKPIKHTELDDFIHNPEGNNESTYINLKDPNKKYTYSDLPKSLKDLMKEMVERVETKLGIEDADLITVELRDFMKDKVKFTQTELVPLMAKLLRILAN